MKNNTKIRLHLSKRLFESLTKQVLAEAKMKKETLSGYTEVKMPKGSKSAKKMEEVDAVSYTNKVRNMGEVNDREETKKMQTMHKMDEKMSSKEKMAKGLYNEDGDTLQPGDNITWLDGHQKENKGVVQSQEEGDYYKVKVTAAPIGGGAKVGDVITKQSGDVKKAMNEKMSSKEKMAKGMYKEDNVNELSGESIAALVALIPGITITAAIIKDIIAYMKSNNLKGIDGFKQAYKAVGGSASGQIDKQMGGNTPGQGHGVKPGRF